MKGGKEAGECPGGGSSWLSRGQRQCRRITQAELRLVHVSPPPPPEELCDLSGPQFPDLKLTVIITPSLQGVREQGAQCLGCFTCQANKQIPSQTMNLILQYQKRGWRAFRCKGYTLSRRHTLQLQRGQKPFIKNILSEEKAQLWFT